MSKENRFKKLFIEESEKMLKQGYDTSLCSFIACLIRAINRCYEVVNYPEDMFYWNHALQILEKKLNINKEKTKPGKLVQYLYEFFAHNPERRMG